LLSGLLTGAWDTIVGTQVKPLSMLRETTMLLKFALVAFWWPPCPAAYTANTLCVVGSATIGPWSLLNVDIAVRPPWPVIGSATRVHVKPSSSDRCT